MVRYLVDGVEHDTKPEPEPAQSEASHPGPGDSPHLTRSRLDSASHPGPLLYRGLPRQNVPDLRLLQDQRQLVMVEKVDHGVLSEQPHG